MNDEISEIDCFRVDGDDRQKRRETIAVEAKMDLVVNDELVTNFLFSPGLEEQLIIGFMLSSGSITDVSDIEKMELEPGVGKVWVSKKNEQDPHIKDVGLTVYHRQLNEIRASLIENQTLHRATRGFHGALLWELSTRKRFVCEDIGRHNAVDKVIGYGIQEGFNFSECMVLLSGRLVSDIVSKCRKSGIPLMASMTVATDGGIKQAKESNMTLIGALSEDGFWLYNEGAVKVT